MRRIVCVTLLFAAACQTTENRLPEGHADWRVHDEYARFRPVAIAVLPVEAPTLELRREIRREAYRRLFDRRYSPFTLQAVDAGLGGLDWDATLEIEITRWRAIKATRHFAADGTAVLEHRTGEVLWSCTFSARSFEVPARTGQRDEAVAAVEIARFLVERIPERAPLPRE